MPFSEKGDVAATDFIAIVAERHRHRPAGHQADLSPPGKRRRLAWRGGRPLPVVLACALVIVNVLLAVVVVHGLRAVYRQVQTTQDVLTALYRLDADIRQISRFHREFLLTGLPPFLTDYRVARQRVPAEVTLIRALTADHADQQRRLDVIVSVLEDDASAVDAAIALARPGPGNRVLEALLGPERLYASVQRLIADMYLDEVRLQATRIGTAVQRTEQALLVSVLRTIVAVALAALVFYLIWRQKMTRDALVAERATVLAGAADALAGATDALQHEVAERHQVEAVLRGREVMLRGLSDAMPQIVFVIYADGTGEFINRRWHDYTGASATFSQAQGWQALVHPDDAGRLRSRWQKAMRPGAPFVAEFRLRGKDGQYRWFLAQAVHVADRDNADAATWVGTLTDINDIHHADTALRDSEKRFRRIFEGSPFGMTLSEGDERRILQANPAFCQMLGYAPGELIGRRLIELSHPDELAENRAFPQLDGVDPGWRTREKRYLTRQGSTVWARIRVAVFDPLGGGGPQLLAVVEDITRQREADEALRQAQRMEAVGQLSAGVAHDFNNLLGVIIGNIEFLLDTIGDDPEQADLAREVLDSALSGAELTRRLLAFGRRQALSPQRIDLNAQVSGHVSLLSRTLGRTIQVETVLADDLWPTRADPSQLADALLNLAINARDAMPHGGVLTIETHNDRVWPEDIEPEPEMAPGDYVALAVSDTGIGMLPEVRARAVEPFFTTKGPGVGTGLGLSMIYGFVRQSGGYLTINSEQGIGTTVRICLPRAWGEDTNVSCEPSRSSLPTGHETILVVDDSSEMRQVAERHLRYLGYSVLTAEHGPAAVALLRAGMPLDLLFTDIAMPEGMNGFQLAEIARRLRPGLKVVFTTGYAGAEGPADAPDWQQQLIRKPYRRPELAEKIRAALN
jgi:PAS domain S-box-containing protein